MKKIRVFRVTESWMVDVESPGDDVGEQDVAAAIFCVERGFITKNDDERVVAFEKDSTCYAKLVAARYGQLGVHLPTEPLKEHLC